jgi:hypothetical protein
MSARRITLTIPVKIEVDVQTWENAYGCSDTDLDIREHVGDTIIVAIGSAFEAQANGSKLRAVAGRAVSRQ